MRAQLEKGGVLGAGQTRKKGGLRCGSGHKRGVFTAAHTYTEHICEYPPPPGHLHVYLTWRAGDFEVLVDEFFPKYIKLRNFKYY